ncbi:hypothetical protein KC330_g8829 [Hortaea werneckii]|nr:hypothetical protein KC330_g8829 [Hortaea werneckii]
MNILKLFVPTTKHVRHGRDWKPVSRTAMGVREVWKSVPQDFDGSDYRDQLFQASRSSSPSSQPEDDVMVGAEWAALPELHTDEDFEYFPRRRQLDLFQFVK